jgi:hypothetical protein
VLREIPQHLISVQDESSALRSAGDGWRIGCLNSIVVVVRQGLLFRSCICGDIVVEGDRKSSRRNCALFRIDGPLRPTLCPIVDRHYSRTQLWILILRDSRPLLGEGYSAPRLNILQNRRPLAQLGGNPFPTGQSKSPPVGGERRGETHGADSRIQPTNANRVRNLHCAFERGIQCSSFSCGETNTRQNWACEKSARSVPR